MQLHKTLYRKLRQIVKRPLWIKGPTNVQFDVTGRCNELCIYCNPQRNHWTPPEDMDFQIVQQVFQQMRGAPLWSVAPFMNGEPLLYGDLTRFLDLAQEYGFNAVLDTNGTIRGQRAKLVHPALKVVRITISAATAETYKLVHGVSKFRDVLLMIKWFELCKLPNQELWLNFIENSENTHEREQWIQRFHHVNRTIWPIHVNVGQPESMKVQIPSGVCSMRAHSSKHITYPNKLVPCQCWNILAIGHDGRIQQCPDVPGDLNYGRVGEVDLLEAWQLRNQNMMDNKYCRSCSLQMPHAKKLFQKYISK